MPDEPIPHVPGVRLEHFVEGSLVCVLSVVAHQGDLGCRLRVLPQAWRTITRRRVPGAQSTFVTSTRGPWTTSLPTNPLLSAVGRTRKKKPGEPLRGRAGSFVVDRRSRLPDGRQPLRGTPCGACCGRRDGRSGGRNGICTGSRPTGCGRRRRANSASGARVGVSGPLPRAGRAGGDTRSPCGTRASTVPCGAAHELRQIGRLVRRRDDTSRREGLLDFPRNTRAASKGKAGTPFRGPCRPDSVAIHPVLWQGADVFRGGAAGAESAGAVSGVAGVQRLGAFTARTTGSGRAARPDPPLPKQAQRLSARSRERGRRGILQTQGD